MFGLSFQELIVIFLIVFLLFGAKALPEIARGLGQAIRIFKREAQEFKEGLSSGDSPQSLAGREEKPAGKKDVSQDFDPSADRRDWRSKADAKDAGDMIK
jgi:sec-independent protein translocase protein TatA